MGLLHRLFKGFLYGNAVGIIFGVAMYLLAGAASAFFTIGASPSAIAGFIYATGVLSGVGMEYSKWMEENK